MLDAALALGAATVAQSACARNAELLSEALCWVLLPAAVAAVKWRQSRSGSRFTALFHETGAVALKKTLPLAVGVVAACAYRSEERVLPFVTFLTPALVLSGAGTANRWSDGAREKWQSALLGPIGVTVTAAFSCFALLVSNEVYLSAVLAGAAAAVGLCGGFVLMSGKNEAAEAQEALASVDVEEVALPWAMCILPLLFATVVLRSLRTSQPSPSVGAVVLAGVFKAAAWFFTLRATRESTLCIAGPVATFAAAASINPFLQPSILHSVPGLLASVISLAQAAALVPKGPVSRVWLAALLALPAIPFAASFFGLQAVSTFLPREYHPVELLMQDAESKLDALLARQSRTYAAAELEYRRRYHIGPPAGFDKWYEYATNRSSLIIDDYDTIYDVISPFLRVNGSKIADIMDRARRVGEDADLWKCKYRSQFGITECEHEWRSYDGEMRKMMQELLVQMMDVLPDMEFFLNPLDEPRVIIPQQGTEDAQHLRIARLDRSPTWSKLTSSCEMRRPVAGQPNQYGIPFVTDLSAAQDLCRHAEYEHMYGMLMSPVTFPTLNGVLPVISVASLSTMGDVLVPSSSYGAEKWAYHPEKDIPWAQKQDSLYWAGSMTGAWAQVDDGSWKNYHRQRLVALTENLEPSQHAYLGDQNGVIRLAKRPHFDTALYNVTFTSVNQCEDDVCKSETSYFGEHPRADVDAPFLYKLVFDIDGNGSSGRFVKLLESQSAVLKQSILREWHDERLLPWLHYIPVSLGLDELPELVEWLIRTDAGREAARKVADRGREWVHTALRKEDREVYLYRIMLELARVQDPNRGALL